MKTSIWLVTAQNCIIYNSYKYTKEVYFYTSRKGTEI